MAVRLRTHVGGPTQTFAALEKALLAVNSSLRNGIALPGTRDCCSFHDPVRSLQDILHGRN